MLTTLTYKSNFKTASFQEFEIGVSIKELWPF